MLAMHRTAVCNFRILFDTIFHSIGFS